MQSRTTQRIGLTPWSLTLGSVSGIPIRIHVTFILLLFWLGLTDAGAKQPSVTEFFFLALLFGCVLLHELAHALTARQFGIRTREIVLYPFGGIATLIGEIRPKAELWIALAGPALNLVLAAALWGFFEFSSGGWFDPTNSLAVRLFEANVVLAVFNMIPALPMDGGRVLRALLAIFKVKNGTAIAGRVSQVLSLSLGAFALYVGNVILLAIAVFVFLGAMEELVREKAKSAATGHTVNEAMIDRSQLTSLSHGTTISEALKLALKSEQDLFPVMYGDQLMGIISREEILRNAVTQSDEQYVSGVMEREFATVERGISLEDLMERLERDSRDPLVVLDGDSFQGFLRRDRLIEFLYVQGMLNQRQYYDDSADQEFQI